jgi:REP element-mobilizing transposase RayT
LKKIHQFIAEQLREQGCPVRIINGMPDHIHCLFLLSPQKSIAEVIKQIKGAALILLTKTISLLKNLRGKRVMLPIQFPNL